jgi:hypothetical protein
MSASSNDGEKRLRTVDYDTTASCGLNENRPNVSLLKEHVLSAEDSPFVE